MNNKDGRKLPVGSSHGSGTAQAVAKLYGILANGGRYEGKQVLSAESIRALEEPAMTGVDQMAGIRVQRGLGTWLMPAISNGDFEKVLLKYIHIQDKLAVIILQILRSISMKTSHDCEVYFNLQLRSNQTVL